MGAPGVQSSLALSWRADHKRREITRPHGGDTQFVYDALGRLVEQRDLVDGVWQSTFIEVDPIGRTTAVLRPNGMASRVTWNLSGQIVQIDRERDWNDPLEAESRTEFDYVAGRLVAVRDSVHAMVPEEYRYDFTGQLVEVGFPGGESLRFDYDARERVGSKQFVRPDASVLRTFEYDYDLAGRVVETREDGFALANLVYANGRVASILYGNGVAVANTYDGVTGALAGFSATDATQQVVATMVVTTTTCGLSLPSSRCKSEFTDTRSGVISTSYSEYQVEDQLTERLIADSVGLLVPEDGFYTYDELSNLTASPLGTFVYNAERNRLLGIEDAGVPLVDYVYDEAGFVTDRGGVPITWNANGRVTSVGSDFTLDWDTFGRKVAADHRGNQTYWRYGGELTEDEFGANQKLDLGGVAVDLDSATHEYRLNDFRGNAKLLLDDTGQVTAHHHYTGYDRWATDGADATGKGFAGGAHVDDLVVVGVRVYDPAAGRFLSEDPVDQAINQYTYTLGNPVRFWDPGGDQASSGVKYRVGTTVGWGGPGPVALLHLEAEFGGGHADGGGGGAEGEGNGSTGGGAATGSASGNAGSGASARCTIETIEVTSNGDGNVIVCGLGFEIAPALVAVAMLRRRVRYGWLRVQ
ncbi:MAG: hypothetical protein GY944_07090 [bacterium]|nr:hypothetical protein [bacterium]